MRGAQSGVKVTVKVKKKRKSHPSYPCLTPLPSFFSSCLRCLHNEAVRCQGAVCVLFVRIWAQFVRTKSVASWVFFSFFSIFLQRPQKLPPPPPRQQKSTCNTRISLDPPFFFLSFRLLWLRFELDRFFFFLSFFLFSSSSSSPLQAPASEIK